MIEISFGKLVLLALIALIVIGPEKLPGAARTAGALLRRMRSGWDSVRAEVERELQIEEIKRTAREAAERADAAQAQLDATLRQVRDPQAFLAEGEEAPAGEPATAEPAMPSLAAAEVAQASHAIDSVRDDVPQGEADTATGDLFAGAAGRPAPDLKEPPHGDA